MIKPISDEDSREILSNGRVGRLGVADAEGPYVVPVSYVFDGRAIYIHSLPGRKIRALRSDPRACLQVDEITDVYNWRSAIAFGRYEELTDDKERAWAVRRLLARYPQLTPVESVPVHDSQSSRVIFRINVEKVTGVAES
jgi:hypothetical protein